tara:strand:- start:4195 stop:4443 length:249 start_codon:yes stop_codon:yes gene_type:complete
MFPDRIIVKDPAVIVRKNLPQGEFTFEQHKMLGVFFLVIPSTAKEVYYLQMLGKNIDLFIPASGDGLIVRQKCLGAGIPLAD